MEIFSYAGKSGILYKNYNVVKELTQGEIAHYQKAPVMKKINFYCRAVPQMIFFFKHFVNYREAEKEEICRYHKGGSILQQEEGLAYYTGRSE